MFYYESVQKPASANLFISTKGIEHEKFKNNLFVDNNIYYFDTTDDLINFEFIDIDPITNIYIGSQKVDFGIKFDEKIYISDPVNSEEIKLYFAKLNLYLIKLRKDVEINE